MRALSLHVGVRGPSGSILLWGKSDKCVVKVGKEGRHHSRLFGPLFGPLLSLVRLLGPGKTYFAPVTLITPNVT